MLKTINLPRQARDKHRENSKNKWRFLIGNYNGKAAAMQPLWNHIASVNGAASLTTNSGAVGDACKNSTGIPAVVAAAKGKEVVVLALGGDCHEGEGTDRDFLGLPGSQSELFTAVLAATTAAKQKLVVVLINGGPISIDEIKGTGASVLAAGFPGQSGGQAIAETLFGLNNPGGKLTTTIYPSSYANGEPMRGTPWMDASLRPHAATNLGTSEGRTHMFYTGTPLFPFGFGLSYTTFSLGFGDAALDDSAAEIVLPIEELDTALANTSFAVKVTNTGERATDRSKRQRHEID